MKQESFTFAKKLTMRHHTENDVIIYYFISCFHKKIVSFSVCKSYNKH